MSGNKRRKINPAAAGNGKALKVLSTSLGVALAANMVLAPAALADGASASNSSNAAGTDKPKLVEWSTGAVKAYYDPSVDWNLPLAGKDQGQAQNGAVNNNGGTGNTQQTIIVHNGLSWSDLLLYHMIFNSGHMYSSTRWYDSRPVYNPRTNVQLKPKTFNSGSFQNKPTVGSSVRPKTVNRSGSITRRGSTGRSTSTSRGSIGRRSGGFGGGFRGGFGG